MDQKKYVELEEKFFFYLLTVKCTKNLLKKLPQNCCKPQGMRKGTKQQQNSNSTTTKKQVNHQTFLLDRNHFCVEFFSHPNTALYHYSVLFMYHHVIVLIWLVSANCINGIDIFEEMDIWKKKILFVFITASMVE